MQYSKSKGRRAFQILNALVLGIASLGCVLPFVNLLAVSLSSGSAAAAGQVGLWPVDFTLSSYEFVLNSKAFITSFGVSLARVALGVSINLLLILLTAYPLSKDKTQFRHRGKYSWFFIFTMLFVPSLIPSYMVVSGFGLMDSIWALVLPYALPVFNMVVMLNFFRSLPKALEEAASIDGCKHWGILWRIYVPLSMPSIATVGLFCIVNHWNAWFDGLIYMNRPEHYPLQSYLQTVVVNPEALFRTMAGNPEVAKTLRFVNNQTTKAAQLFIATIPVLVAYPFLQSYFTAGLVLGSVKE